MRKLDQYRFDVFKSEEVVKEAKNKIDSLSNIDIRKEIINTNKENVKKKKGIKKGKKSEDGKEIINNIEENIIKGNNNNNNNIRENSKERQIMKYLMIIIQKEMRIIIMKFHLIVK